VRLRGRNRDAKPVLFLGHLDVVQALKQDWSPNLDPFKFTEAGGYFYGRGTSDVKDGDALLLSSFIRLKREGWVPSRDLILALTADEEGGESNGIQWLLKNHRELIDAEYCINTDAGDFVIVVNARGVKLTGKKLEQKIYYRHTEYPGGIRERTAAKLLTEKPEDLIRLAVKGMLPKNRLSRKLVTKLKVYAGPEHPHEAQKPQPLAI